MPEISRSVSLSPAGRICESPQCSTLIEGGGGPCVEVFELPASPTPAPQAVNPPRDSVAAKASWTEIVLFRQCEGFPGERRLNRSDMGRTFPNAIEVLAEFSSLVGKAPSSSGTARRACTAFWGQKQRSPLDFNFLARIVAPSEDRHKTRYATFGAAMYVTQINIGLQISS